MFMIQERSAIDCQIEIDDAPYQPWTRDIEHKTLNLPTEILVDGQLVAIRLAKVELCSGKYHLSLNYSLPRIFYREDCQNAEIRTSYDSKTIYRTTLKAGGKTHDASETFLDDLNASLELKLYSAKLDSSTFEPKSGLWSDYNLEKKVVANHIFTAADNCDQSSIDLLQAFTASYPQYRGARQLLAEMLLENGDTKTANEILEKLQSEDLRNIETDRLLIRTRSILFGSPDIENYQEALKTRFCAMPFEYFLAPASKTCWLCPPTYLPVCVGDIALDNFESAANSEWSYKIRNSILDNSYRYCLWLLCPRIQNTMREFEVVKKNPESIGPLPQGLPKTKNIGNARLKTIISENRYHLDKLEKVEFGYDWTCNLACPSCRNYFFKNTPEELRKLDRIKSNFVFPALSKIRTLMFGASGEPLASSHYHEVLSQLSKEKYPDLELEICTNGLLFQKCWNELPKLKGVLKGIQVSIDAATKATYKVVRRGGSWSLLKKNLELLSQLRSDRIIDRFSINFTVQQANYKEIAAFVRMGKNFCCDKVVLRRIVNYGNVSAQEHQARDVCNPMHPHYDDLMKLLKDPILSDPIVFMTNVITL